MVIFVPNPEPNNEQISDGVNLLISILIRHPEIATVSFTPPNKCITLKFMLSTSPSAFEFSTIKRLVTDSITAYHMLEGLSMEFFEMELYSYDQVAIVSIIRDIKTISKDEISLITSLLQEHLKKYLIIDPHDSLSEEDLSRQEEVMEDMLENINYHSTMHPLIGIRENGRILIFNK